MIKNLRTFYINSANRIEGKDDSDFSIGLDLNPHEEYNRVCLLEASIPKSYYLVQSGLNTFTLTELGQNITITVPPGNYSSSSFATVLASQLTASSTHAWTYTITYPATRSNPDTGKFTYTVTGNAGNQPSFTFTDFIYEQMGFSANSTNTFVGSTLTSTNVIKMQIEDCLYLHSNICTNGKDNILQSIFTSGVSDFSNINYQCPNHLLMAKKISAQTQNVYRFTLMNEFGTTMNLNGRNMNFTIAIFNSI